MTKLTAALCVRNEEARLPACLAALDFADEIVVLLDRTTDGSAAVARAAGARVVEGAWEIEGERRHAAIAEAANPWVLEVDADETASPLLGQEIRARLAADDCDVLTIPFANYVAGRLIRYGWGAYNGVGAKACLFRKGAKTWGHERVHPKITLHGRRGALTNTMRHDVYDDIAGIMAKLNRYSDLRALDLAETGDAGSRAQAVRRVFSRFWKAYVARRGYREGETGFALALMAGLFPLLSHLKAQEILAAQRDGKT